MTEALSYIARDYADLEKFTRAVWGKPGAVLKKSGHIEFIDLEPYPALQELFVTRVPNNKILVREEYRTALKALETQRYHFGAYVTGQSGIGKTLFLIYVIVARLERELVVALQFPDGRPFYAIFYRTVSFHSLLHRSPLRSFPFLWALTGSNDLVQSPSGIFRGNPGQIRVIQATSPKEIHWKGWSKHTGAKAYVMDIWSEKEIADLANLLGLDASDTKRMIDLGKNWGFVPRTLLDFIDHNTSDSKIEKSYQRAARLAIANLGNVIDAVTQNALSDDPPSQVFFCRPDTTDRSVSCADAPTRTIRRFLGEALQRLNNSARADFYSALRQSDDASQAAGMLFEHWFHSFFSAGKPVKCNWVQVGEGTTLLASVNPRWYHTIGYRRLPAATSGYQRLPLVVHADVTGPTTHARSVLKVLETVSPPYLWIAPRGFAGIHSVLVHEKEIYAFQITTGSNHDPPIEGMLAVRNSLYGEVKELPWRMLFVGYDKDVVRQVARQWVDKICFPTDKTSVPVGWSALDPVQLDITYNDFEDLDEAPMDASE